MHESLLMFKQFMLLLDAKRRIIFFLSGLSFFCRLITFSYPQLNSRSVFVTISQPATCELLRCWFVLRSLPFLPRFFSNYGLIMHILLGFWTFDFFFTEIRLKRFVRNVRASFHCFYLWCQCGVWNKIVRLNLLSYLSHWSCKLKINLFEDMDRINVSKYCWLIKNDLFC